MKKIAKAAAVTLLLAVISMGNANAQTSYRTNLLINLSFSLTGYEQVYLFLSTDGFSGPYAPVAKTVKVTTPGIISAIAKHAQITNDLSTAKLYWRLSWTNSSDNDITRDIIIRRGATDTVVNNYAQISFPDSVSSVRATLSGTTNVTDYANCIISLSTSQGAFTLHGVATLKSASLLYSGHLADPNPYPVSFTSTVAGSGSIGFHQAEWKGTVTGSGQKVEIEQISP